jgi:hypothetical protein
LEVEGIPVNPPPGVEDPISSIFDLSDRVAQMAPTVRRLYRYTAVILVLWIVIMAIVTLFTFGSNFLIAGLAIVGFIVGVIALSLLRQTDAFFRGFVQRHRAIRLVREADPVVKIPEGRTPIERLNRYLVEENPTVARLVHDHSDAVRYRITLSGRGRSVPFDLVIERPGSWFARTLGTGDPGFAVVARLATGAITLVDLQRMEADVVDSLPSFRGVPLRLILLRPQPAPLPEDAYEYAVGHPVLLGGRLTHHRASLEVITENPDGTYDFVPRVLGVP